MDVLKMKTLGTGWEPCFFFVARKERIESYLDLNSKVIDLLL